MGIDSTVKDSPGWWLAKGARKLAARLPRLQLLADHHDGNPPLPGTSDANASAAFREFRAKAGTNFAELIVGSLRERCTVRDIRTARSADEADEEAWRIWKENGMDVEFADVLENMLALADGYMIVGVEDGRPVITGEDPRQVVTFHNPARQSEVRAAVKLYHDADEQRDYAYLYLPGVRTGLGLFSKARRYVAYRTRRAAGATALRFTPSAYEWDEDRGGADGEELSHHLVPVVRFRNRRGIGEFEPHLNIINRINHGVYNRLVIAAYQAYKQMVIHIDPDETEDEDGNPLDRIPDDVLTTDPGSWVQLPLKSKVWQAAQADMQGILSSVKDDIRALAAVTRRPLAMFAPDNESAFGAQSNMEGIIFATEDKQTRAGAALADVFRLAFLSIGDTERADRARITIGWTPAFRVSLTDKANATAQASTTLAKATILREVWQMKPDEVARAEAELADEALLMTDPAGSAANGQSDESVRASALALLIRQGVEPVEAAARVGLTAVQPAPAEPASTPTVA